MSEFQRGYNAGTITILKTVSKHARGPNYTPDPVIESLRQLLGDKKLTNLNLRSWQASRDQRFSQCLMSGDSGGVVRMYGSAMGSPSPTRNTRTEGSSRVYKYGSHLTPGLRRGQVCAASLTAFLAGFLRAGDSP